MLRSDAEGKLVLTHYPAGGSQARHEHAHAQLSFLLCGEIEENIGRRSHAPIVNSACFKPAGTDHSDRWGAGGALILALNLPRMEDGFDPLPRTQWLPAHAGGLDRILRALLDERMTAASALLGADLIACVSPCPTPRRESAPSWLQRVREAAIEAPEFNVALAAAEAGVHRVHLSRAFARHYGMPLSVYRHRTQVARAVEAAVRETETLAAVADAASFADQSHMTRAVRAATGTSPGRLRRLFT